MLHYMCSMSDTLQWHKQSNKQQKQLHVSSMLH